MQPPGFDGQLDSLAFLRAGRAVEARDEPAAPASGRFGFGSYRLTA
jgi:hypothetical protein